MTSVNDDSYPIQGLPPQGQQPQFGYQLPRTRPYRPQPQIPAYRPLDAKYYINTATPNPFTIKPIETQWLTNELLLIDPRLRAAAKASPLDIGLKQSSNYVSPQHLNPGWKWCGGYPNCERQ